MSRRCLHALYMLFARWAGPSRMFFALREGGGNMFIINERRTPGKPREHSRTPSTGAYKSAEHFHSTLLSCSKLLLIALLAWEEMALMYWIDSPMATYRPRQIYDPFRELRQMERQAMQLMNSVCDDGREEVGGNTIGEVKPKPWFHYFLKHIYCSEIPKSEKKRIAKINCSRSPMMLRSSPSPWTALVSGPKSSRWMWRARHWSWKVDTRRNPIRMEPSKDISFGNTLCQRMSTRKVCKNLLICFVKSVIMPWEKL